MNTPMDTDEGRPRPSVWPVYVATVLVAIYGVWDLGTAVLLLLTQAEVDVALATYALLRAVRGLFAVLAAVGLVLLRAWGWWCTVIYVAMFVVFASLLVVVEPHQLGAYLWDMAVIALLVWPLATRRRLFFPGT